MDRSKYPIASAVLRVEGDASFWRLDLEPRSGIVSTKFVSVVAHDQAIRDRDKVHSI